MASTNQRKKPTQERSVATVQAILEATAQVLVEGGYDRASTNRIAKRAGVSVGTLYQYFESKEALVRTLGERHVERMLGSMAQSFGAHADATIAVLTREVVEGLVRAHQVEPELHRVLVTQTPMDVVATMRGAIESLLAADMRRRRALDENRVQDPDLAAFLVVAAVDGAITSAVVRRPDLLADGRLVEGLVEVVLRFVLPVHDP